MRTSAFSVSRKDTRSDSRGFEAPSFTSSSSYSSRAPPDTPARAVTKRELLRREPLYSSIKKPSHTGAFRAVSSPVSSSTITMRKRLKDTSDTASPTRQSHVPPQSPIRDVSSRAWSEEGSEDMEEELSRFARSETELAEQDDEELLEDTFPVMDDLALIGTGHFSEVKKVRCHSNSKLYALKVSKDNDRLVSLGRKKTVVEELNMWGELRHPNIVRLYRAWQEDAKLYVLMQLCESGTLETFYLRELDQGRRMDDNLLKLAFRDVLSALDYMHTKQRMVHMDVKPENICLRQGRALLCDMGIIRRIGSVLNVSTDVQYVAKEAVSPEYIVHPSADIFALGISLFRMCARIRDMPRETAVLRDVPPTADEFPDVLYHQDIFQLSLRSMAFDPYARPTASMLLAEPCLQISSMLRFPLREEETRTIFNRPASATLASGSPRESDLSIRAFPGVHSPVSPSPAASRNASRNGSPFAYHKRLDFGSSPNLADAAAEVEGSLSDRFRTQAVVTPRNLNTPGLMQFPSRSSSPRPMTSSPQLFVGSFPSADKPPQRPRPVAPSPTN